MSTSLDGETRIDITVTIAFLLSDWRGCSVFNRVHSLGDIAWKSRVAKSILQSSAMTRP